MNFLRSPKVIFPIILILLVVLGMHTRILPMTMHGATPGLWDHTTNDWTLGPDLDPWSFVKNAKIIADNGSLPQVDHLRNIPLGVDNSRETMLLPYMIYGLYEIVNLFGDFNMEFAGALFPVIIFGLTIIIFFLFTREIFVSDGKLKANIIASIATLFFITIPSLLPRTVAGIPEKESAGFLFMFLSFYLLLKSVKSKNIKDIIFFGILSGISTALMRFIWGGAIYIFATIFIAMLVAFLFNKLDKKLYISYTSWIFTTCIIMVMFSEWFTFSSLLTLSYTSSCILLWLFLTIHLILWDTRIANNKILKYLNNKIPKNILSICISLTALIPLSLIIFGPQFIIDKLQTIYELLFNPITGRWNTTVAENRPPFLQEWMGNFGPFIGKIPLMLTLFITGSILFFKETLSNLGKKESLRLTIIYIIFLFGIMFSRISPSSIFNGHNFISQFLFLGSLSFFLISLLSYSIKYTKDGKGILENIKFENLLLMSLFILCLFTVRGAIRLTMVLASVAPIFVGYLIVKTYSYATRDNHSVAGVLVGKRPNIVVAFIFIIILMSSVFVIHVFYQTTTTQSYNFVPNYYNIQWQNAMGWVRDTTPADAVFAHWWDYGYWVQAIGERATVTDGGNVITYWNYLMGRHVLTGDNQNDALEFLYNHDTDYLLIDSSDIAKYGAYSSIGSNKDYDRFSIVPTLFLNPEQSYETNNATISFYQGNTGLDEDIIYKTNGTTYFFPQSQSSIYGVLITENDNEINKVEILILNKGILTPIQLRYAQDNKRYYDFKEGLNGTIKIINRVDSAGNILTKGALIYASPRVSKTLLSHLYILDDPTDKFSNFGIAHIEPDIFTQQNEIFYYDPVGIIGPIKIWSITYSGDEEYMEEYIDTDPTKYLDWKL